MKMLSGLGQTEDTTESADRRGRTAGFSRGKSGKKNYAVNRSYLMPLGKLLRARADKMMRGEGGRFYILLRASLPQASTTTRGRTKSGVQSTEVRSRI